MTIKITYSNERFTKRLKNKKNKYNKTRKIKLTKAQQLQQICDDLVYEKLQKKNNII